MIFLCSILSFLITHQEKPTEKQILKWLEELGHDDPKVRDTATQKLIENGCDKECEQSLKSDDAEVKMRAEIITQKVKSLRDYIEGDIDFRKVYERYSKFDEELKEEEKKNWIDIIGKKLAEDPYFIGPKKRKNLAEEILKDENILKKLMVDYRFHGSATKAWFFMELLDNKDEKLRTIFLNSLLYSVSQCEDKFLEMMLFTLINKPIKLNDKSLSIGPLLARIIERLDKIPDEAMNHMLGKIDILENTKDSEYIWSAIRKHINSKQLESVVEKCLKNVGEKDEKVRKNAIFALFRIVSELGDKLSESSIKSIQESIGNKEIAKKTDNKSKLKLISKFFESKLVEEQVLPLIEKLNSKDNKEFYTAFFQLKPIAKKLEGKLLEDVVKALANNLECKDERIGKGCISVLETISECAETQFPNETIKALLEKFESKEAWIRDGIDSILTKLSSRIDGKQLEEALKGLLLKSQSKNADARSRSISILMELSRRLDEKQLELLVKEMLPRITDEDSQVCRKASVVTRLVAGKLKKYLLKEMVKSLLTNLSHKDQEVRHTIVQVLEIYASRMEKKSREGVILTLEAQLEKEDANSKVAAVLKQTLTLLQSRN